MLSQGAPQSVHTRGTEAFQTEHNFYNFFVSFVIIITEENKKCITLQESSEHTVTLK